MRIQICNFKSFWRTFQYLRLLASYWIIKFINYNKKRKKNREKKASLSVKISENVNSKNMEEKLSNEMIENNEIVEIMWMKKIKVYTTSLWMEINIKTKKKNKKITKLFVFLMNE